MPPDPIRPDTSGVPLVELTRLVETIAGTPDATGITVTGVTLDSRSVLPGDLYAALPGFNVHGAGFAADAIAHGAVAVLTDPAGAKLLAGTKLLAGGDHEQLGPRPAVPVLVVPAPRAILGSIASVVYGNPSTDLTMIGITGTNGKTTTAYLIEAALRCHGHRTGLIGTVETRIGDARLDSVRTTPETTDLHAILAVMRQRDVDDCVMEVSSHALALHRVDGVRFDVALFTNLSQDHLDFHHSMEEYFGAKAALFTPERAGRGVICVDDEWGARLAAETAIPVSTLSTLSTAAPAPVDADWQVQSDVDGAFSLTRMRDGLTLDLVSHLPGTFNITNTALAALALLECGIEPADVAIAMASPPTVPGRMEVVVEGGADLPRCIVDYAHTPDAVDAALAALRPSTTGRLIAVLGAGGDRDHGKRGAMGAAAARRADVVVVTDDNPRSEDPAAIRSAVADGARCLIASGEAASGEVVDGGSRSRAITEAIALAVAGAKTGAETGATRAEPGRAGRVDTVVVLGKGHEKGQEIHGVIRPFDDHDAVRVAIEAAIEGGAGA
ncbi:MAG: UDP-N-acetylmuramoyl-L-alanyl-D-glutamate--2,6-diaminopimelate ligase [Micrococcales bacterium]|nr:UDP-N-acetylmuramoyl-L-alanyl-D-glutamate--2,6-diaminopimelate ligase [Micrococcales bacterium]